MNDLSPHFSRHEFRCPCGCGVDTVDADLLYLCEVVRKIEGKPVTVTSGHRCQDHNRAVGGGENSMHLWGRAADLAVSSPQRVYNELCRLFPDTYGFGLYRTHVHVDSRATKARWTHE
jgi:uncharacterized protein YcbK (DUF882 family)